MGLPWVKLHVGLLHNVDFKRLTRAAKLTFLIAVPLAADCESGGLLRTRTGPLSAVEIAYFTGLSVAQQHSAIKELVSSGFLANGLDGSYAVSKWEEKAGEESKRSSNRDRQRRHRERLRNAGNAVTNAVTVTQNVTDIDQELDIDRSLRDLPLKKSVKEGDLPGFGDLESDVVAYISNAAEENKTKRITLGRELGLRRELETLAEKLANPLIFAAGLRAANAAGVANVNYVAKCAASFAKKGDVKPASRAAFEGIPRD